MKLINKLATNYSESIMSARKMMGASLRPDHIAQKAYKDGFREAQTQALAAFHGIQTKEAIDAYLCIENLGEAETE